MKDKKVCKVYSRKTHELIKTYTAKERIEYLKNLSGTLCDQVFEKEDIVFSHEIDILMQLFKIELTYRISKETDRHLHPTLADRRIIWEPLEGEKAEEKEPPRYSWASEEAYKNLKIYRKRMKKLWASVMSDIEKGENKMTQEKIERIMTLENERKEMKKQIEYTKEVMEGNRSGFSVVVGRPSCRGTGLPLIPVSKKIVEMAIEELEKELQAIEQELEQM